MKLSMLQPVSGIYKICNTKNGKVYIGQAHNFLLRWANHVEDLFLERHSNSSLLKDFQKYGIRAFTVEIIERCESDKKTLLSRERYWIAQHYQQGFDLYNSNIDMYWYTKNDGKNYHEVIAESKKELRKNKKTDYENEISKLLDWLKTAPKKSKKNFADKKDPTIKIMTAVIKSFYTGLL